MPQKRQKHMLAFIADEKDSINADDNSINFVISSDKVDRDRERIEVAAVAGAIKDFSKNPVALACHQHRLSDGKSPVVGNWDTDTFAAKAHHSEMRLKFAVGTDLGKDYWYLYSNKFQRAVSIGFYILDGHEERTGGSRIYVITKIELFEISCVPVGANRQALSKTKEVLGDLPQLEIAELTLQIQELNTSFKDNLNGLQQQLDEIRDLMVPDSERYAGELLGANPDSSPSAGTKDNQAEFLNALSNVIKKFSQ